MVPMFISLYYVVKGKPDKAFLNVYLPSLFLLPHYFLFSLPHMPNWSASEGALMPIAISLLIRPVTKWRFRRMDLWVVLFIASAGFSEVLREKFPEYGLFLWLTEFVQMFLVYVVGRQIIEPKLRLETIKRIVFLLMCLTPCIFMEFVFHKNPWLRFSAFFFGEGASGWYEQSRGGHVRIAACYGHAILAGMVFMTGMALNYFLVQIYKVDKQRLGKWMGKLQKYRIPFFLLPLFLLLTSSRGPMICAVLCFMVMQIPRFKSVRTGAVVILLILTAGGIAVNSFYQKYTNPEQGQEMDEAQTSAIYRRELLKNYAPILEEGGWLGWGALSHPQAGGQDSIDNYYLLVHLGQGKLGIYSFTLVAVEAVLSMILCAVRFKSRESLFFTFCMMGALAGLFASLRTVYLGEQVPEVLFLLLGWSQSLLDVGPATADARVSAVEPKFRFRRVIA